MKKVKMKALRQIGEQWLKIKSVDIKPKTERYYRQTLDRIYKAIAELGVKKIALVDKLGQDILDLMYINNYSKSTMQGVRIVYKMLADFAGYYIESPLKVNKNASTKFVEAMTIKDEAIIRKFCYEDMHGDLMLFLLATGLRKCEFKRLCWADYDKENELIKIRASKTENGIRVVPLNRLARQMIDIQPHRSDYIFTQKNGKPITDTVLKKTYLRLRKKTGVTTLTNHICRHTAATRMIMNEADAAAASKILGHKSVSFTIQRYVTPHFEDMAELVNKIG